MDYLDILFNCLEEEPPPDTPEYRESKNIRGLLLDDIQKAMGPEVAEKAAAIFDGHETLECRRFFRCGLRLGLELLGLLV